MSTTSLFEPPLTLYSSSLNCILSKAIQKINSHLAVNRAETLLPSKQTDRVDLVFDARASNKHHLPYLCDRRRKFLVCIRH